MEWSFTISIPYWILAIIFFILGALIVSALWAIYKEDD